MRTARAYRRTYAVLVGLLWLLGVEVLPNLHLSTHDARPHTHAADGTVVIVTFDRDVEPHRHADGTFHSHAAIEGANPRTHIDTRAHASDARHRHHHRPGVLAFDLAPDTHAAAGIAHRAAALHPTSPPVVDVSRIDAIVTEQLALDTGRATVALIATRDARGPPATS